jgi:hypothetical protein
MDIIVRNHQTSRICNILEAAFAGRSQTGGGIRRMAV